MGARIDPVTGTVTGMSGSMGGGVPNLTPEMRHEAEYHCGIADDLLAYLDQGHRYFTCYKLRMTHHDLEPLVKTGVVIKEKSQNHDGFFYRVTPYTRPWCLTALALRQERLKRMGEK